MRHEQECVYVSVSLMHCCSFVRYTGPGIAAVGASGASGRHRYRHRCDAGLLAHKLGDKNKNTRHQRRSSCSQRGVDPGQICCVQVRGTFGRFPLLAPEGTCGSRDGSMDDGWRKEQKEGPFPAPGLHLAVYLESLLMTRISAPFSSFRRWLSALRSTRTWLETTSNFTPHKATLTQQEHPESSHLQLLLQLSQPSLQHPPVLVSERSEGQRW